MFEVDFHILNQKATPAIYADTLANRPTFGFAGRIFINTASPYGVYRDTGSAWVQVAGIGGGPGSTGVNGLNGTTNIGLGGTLANNTTINGNFNLDFFHKSFTVNAQNSTTFNVSTYTNNGNSNVLKQLDANSSLYSELFLEPFIIYSKYNSLNYGLSLNDTTGKFALGDYNNDRKYNSFVVNDDTNEFYLTTSFNQANTDQDLFFASNSSSSIRFVKIGDFNAYQNNISLVVDDANYRIFTTGTNATKGFDLDFNNEVYNFADTNAKITCDAVNQSIELETNNLKFTGSISTSIPPTSGSILYLEVYVNNILYNILMTRP